MVQILGAKGAFDDWMDRFAPGTFDDFIEGLAGFVATQEAQWLINNTPSDVIRIPARQFGPVDVTAEEWSERRLPGLDPVVEFLDHRSYLPLAVGSSEIVVQTKGSEFGDAEPAETRETLTVQTIDLDLEPTEVVMQPDEGRDFTVHVENSAFPEKVEVVRPVGRALLTSFDPDANSHNLAYTAPSSVGGFPELVEVRHTAETGARRPELSPPRRRGSATVRSKAEVRISPRSSCIGTEATLQLEAEVVGLESQAVTWDSDGGTIDSTTGFFTAPSVRQNVTITATSVEDDEVEGTAVVRVGGCDCWWSLFARGMLWTSESGDFADWGTDPTGFLAGDALTEIPGALGPTGAGFLTLEPAPVGHTGSFRVAGHADGAIFGSETAPEDLQADNPFTTGTRETWTLGLSEHEAEVLEGTVEGVAWFQEVVEGPDGQTSEWRSTTLEWEFRFVDDNTDPPGKIGRTNQCTVE